MPLLAAPPLSLNNAVPFTRPVPVPPNSNGLLPRLPGVGLLGVVGGSLFALDLIGQAGGYKWRDDLLAKTGNSPVSRPSGDTAPFAGGQSTGVLYNVRIRYTNMSGLMIEYSINNQRGAIGGLSAKIVYNEFLGRNAKSVYLTTGEGEQGILTEEVHFKKGTFPSIIRIDRVDGQPDTGTGDNRALLPPVPAGYTPSASPFSGADASPQTPTRARPNQDKKVGSPVGGSIPPTALKTPPTAPPVTNPPPTPQRTPPNAPPTPPSPQRTPPPTPEKDKKKAPTPPTPNENRPPDLGERLRELGAILLLILGNTQFDNLKNAARTGSCESLQSPQCTKGVEDRIKDPLIGKLDAAQVARDGLAVEQRATLEGMKLTLATIAAKATDIFDLVGKVFNNSIVDKAMQYITMITVIHNAAMLSRGIADTLGSALDSGLQAFGLQIKDKDGNQQSVTQVIGKSFENLIKGVIGVENYTALNATWTQANRVYQTGINLLSNVQAIVDSTTAVAELTSSRLGTLMNALRNSGSVRENAYGAQSQNVTKFNAFQNKLENLEQGVSNTASIAGNIVSVQQSVNELKTNRQEFENSLKDKPVGTGIAENNPEKDARAVKKEQSLYTISDFSIVKPPETP